MTHPPLIQALQKTCWEIELISKQLTTLATQNHPYHLLLLLLQRNILEVCAFLKNHIDTDFSEATTRIQELILFIMLLRDYAFDSIHDEKIDRHLTQIKQGLEYVLPLMTSSLLMNTQEEPFVEIA